MHSLVAHVAATAKHSDRSASANVRQPTENRAMPSHRGIQSPSH